MYGIFAQGYEREGTYKKGRNIVRDIRQGELRLRRGYDEGGFNRGRRQKVYDKRSRSKQNRGYIRQYKQRVFQPVRA